MASGRTLLEVDEKKPPGFFPKLYESVVMNMGKEKLEEMERMSDASECLIRFTYSLDNFKKALTIRDSYPEKNKHEAKVKKEYGNKAYQEGKDLDALFLYTQAVLAAPCDEETGCSKDLSVTLANRSAVLFSLKVYHLALDDIRLALESGYPKELRFKLLERRAKILTFYKQHSSAREAFKQTMKALDDAKVDAQKKMKIQKDVQQMLTFYERAPSVYDDPNTKIYPEIEHPKLETRNPKYPAMADCIQFRYQEGRGRYAVATRDVAVGEFICVEQPTVSRILPEFSGSNCSNCFRAMKAPLPCPTCTKVMFCSYKCREVALTTYHRYECKIIDFLLASGMSIICFLAYRAITKNSLQFFKENRDKFTNHDEKAGQTKGQTDKYLSDDYRNLYNLVTHHEERKFGDIFHRSMFSVMLLRCLKRHGYFGPDRTDVTPAGDSLSDDELFIGNLLNHFLEVLQFNSHEVAQFEMIAKNREAGAESNFIGAGIYPTLAMFNHSCDPSIVRFYVEDVVAVQAIKNIRKGEEICENYGPIFFHSSREDRQKRLKTQYWFDCACVPCKEDWPLMHEMDSDTLTFRCTACNGAVPFIADSSNPLLRCECGTPVPMLQALKKITETDMISAKAKAAMESGDLAHAQDLYCDYLTTLDTYLVPPYPDYYKIQQSIWKCIWMRFGNRVIKSKMRKATTVACDDYDTVD